MPSPQRSLGHSLFKQKFSQKFLCLFVCVFFCVFCFLFYQISKFALPGVMLMYERTSKDRTGFALGFIFLSPPFSPIRFFLCHFLELRARFWPFFAQKEPGLGVFFAKKCHLSLTPFILVDYCTHIDKITKE